MAVFLAEMTQNDRFLNVFFTPPAQMIERGELGGQESGGKILTRIYTDLHGLKNGEINYLQLYPESI